MHMADMLRLKVWLVKDGNKRDLLWSAGPAAVVLDVSCRSDPTHNNGYPSTDQVEPLEKNTESRINALVDSTVTPSVCFATLHCSNFVSIAESSFTFEPLYEKKSTKV